MPHTNLLRFAAVERKVQFGSSTIYRWMAKGAFPKPIKDGRNVRWLESEIDSWIDARIEARDQPARAVRRRARAARAPQLDAVAEP